MSRSQPEILAPVGSAEMLEAAVRCGADAVYLGHGPFHARQGAEDFGSLSLADIVSYCHTRGVSVHLTMNTLLCETELPEALQSVREACDAGVDALIVQDLGLAHLCREAAPSLPLHASTQLACHTPEGVRQLAALGFSRVVLAREMSAEEIRACAGLGTELEVFVHGALCMSVSGQCYLSAMLGGRSGNRGRCAQACRLPFAPAGTVREARETACLSLRDLSILDRIPALWEAGVCSFKIEGRRKRPEYVAAAVTAARRAADGLPPDAALLQDLQNVFSRSGFTDGYYTGRRGRALFGVRRKEDVVAAEGAQKRLRQLYHKETGRIPVSLSLRLNKACTTLTVCDDEGHSVTVRGVTPLPSDRPADIERLRDKLSGTGGTPFYARTVEAAADGALYLPASVLGSLRRTALEQLAAQRGQPIPHTFTPPTITAAPTPHGEPRRCYLRLADAAQLSPAMETADRLFLPLDTDPSLLHTWAEHVSVGVEIPRALFGAEAAVRSRLRLAAEAGCTAALVGNIGALPLAREAGLRPVGHFSLNLTNHAALKALSEAGLAEALLSAELTFPQMRLACPETLSVGVLSYGRLPLMLMRPCPRQAAVGCGGCERHGGLVDRKGTVFPLACREGSTELLNSVPIYWGDRPEELPPLDFELLYFTTETADEATDILRAYRRHDPSEKPITRGLYRRGVE